MRHPGLKTRTREMAQKTRKTPAQLAIDSLLKSGTHPLSPAQKKKQREIWMKLLNRDPHPADILFEIRKAKDLDLPEKTRKFIDQLSFIEGLSKKFSVPPTDSEQFLCATLEALGHLFFTVRRRQKGPSPGCPLDEFIGRMAYTYAILSRTEVLRPYELHEWFIEHLRIQKERLGRPGRRRKIKETQAPLTDHEKRALFAEFSLPKPDVARLFKVRLRQVQRWIEKGEMRSRDGQVPRQVYLDFSRRSRNKCGRVALDFHRLMRDREATLLPGPEQKGKIQPQEKLKKR